MNWKLFGTMTALIGVGASIALAQGTAPTIVQGDYISNVFGNSNFIKNPNAKLNTKDVTTVTATVLRSTNTPLVATSEFTVAIGTANGTATWATRAFDAGMKGQNCEARFSYRGFAATSKVHIKQGANTVATLNLTPATDPRIASINFPCGDLSAATTFVVTDTAILAGTNEIGGIYVGLATNMANVAQAEFVGSLSWATGSDSNQLTATTFTPFGNFTAAPTVLGSVTSSSNAPAFTIPSFKAGNYRVILSGQCMTFSSTITDTSAAFRLTDGTTQYGISFVSRNLNPTTGANIGDANSCGSFDFQYTGASISKTFQIEGAVSVSGTTMRLERSALVGFQISVYRFPSSSELVVTPERQNTFAGVRLYSGTNTNIVTTGTVTKLTTPTTATRTSYGKADTTATNDLSVTIRNLPVGSYRIEATGTMFARAPSAGATAACIFSLSDSATAGSPLSSMYANAYGDASTAIQDMIVSSTSGVYVNTSVADRTFFVRAQRAGGTGSCLAYSDDQSPFNIIVTPLDQPSNSALYVQGPVLGAQTGAAISAGYVGELKYAITSSATNWPVASGSWATLNSVVLPIGVWSCTGTVSFYRNAATFAGTVVNYMQANFSDVSGAASNYSRGFNQTTFELAIPNTFDAVSLPIRPITLRSNGSQIIWPDGTARGTTTLYLNSFLYNWTAGTPQHVNVIECTRLN